MKKILLSCLLALGFGVNAQQWSGATNSIDYISRTGNIGIGTSLNVDKFNLSGNLRMIDGAIKFGYVSHSLLAGWPNSYYDIEYLGNGLYFHPSRPNVIGFGDPTHESGVLFLSLSDKVGIGTDNTDGCEDCEDYRLFVKDGIKTEKVKVDIAQDNGWADYVFDDHHHLLPLEDLKGYISENKHLPEVPTTEEAVKNGIELKEMNILLLKKIEELTLYIIKQNDEIKAQSERIENIEKRNN
jgi:hypothetical protein